MKILRIPTFWTAEQAATIHEFLGELQAAVWQEYHEDIQKMYQEIKEQSHRDHIETIDDDVEF